MANKVFRGKRAALEARRFFDKKKADKIVAITQLRLAQQKGVNPAIVRNLSRLDNDTLVRTIGVDRFKIRASQGVKRDNLIKAAILRQNRAAQNKAFLDTQLVEPQKSLTGRPEDIGKSAAQLAFESRNRSIARKIKKELDARSAELKFQQLNRQRASLPKDKLEQEIEQRTQAYDTIQRAIANKQDKAKQRFATAAAARASFVDTILSKIRVPQKKRQLLARIANIAPGIAEQASLAGATTFDVIPLLYQGINKLGAANKAAVYSVLQDKNKLRTLKSLFKASRAQNIVGAKAVAQELSPVLYSNNAKKWYINDRGLDNFVSAFVTAAVISGAGVGVRNLKVNKVKNINTAKKTGNTLLIDEKGRYSIIDAKGKVKTLTSKEGKALSKYIRQTQKKIQLKKSQAGKKAAITRQKQGLTKKELKIQQRKLRAQKQKLLERQQKKNETLRLKQIKRAGFKDLKEYKNYKRLSEKSRFSAIAEKKLNKLEKKIRNRITTKRSKIAKKAAKTRIDRRNAQILQKVQEELRALSDTGLTKAQAQAQRRAFFKDIESNIAVQNIRGLSKSQVALERALTAKKLGFRSLGEFKKYQNLLQKARNGNKKAIIKVRKLQAQAAKRIKTLKSKAAVRYAKERYNQIRKLLKDTNRVIKKAPAKKNQLKFARKKRRAISRKEKRKGTQLKTVKKTILKKNADGTVVKQEIQVKQRVAQKRPLKTRQATRRIGKSAVLERLARKTAAKTKQKTRARVSQKQIQGQKNKQSTKDKIILRTVQRRAASTKSALNQKRAQVQAQARLSRLQLKSKQKAKTIKRTKTQKKRRIPKIPPKKPEFEKKEEMLTIKNAKSFNVLVKKGNRLVKINRQKLSYAQSQNLLRYVLDKSIAASGIIFPAGKKIPKKTSKIPFVPRSKFRAPRIGSKLRSASVVEKNRYRIDSTGEKRKLSASAVYARLKKSPKRKKRKTNKAARKRQTIKKKSSSRGRKK